jgi:hypothetical protein
MHWRAEPVNVEKFLDEAWVGVKGQSNWEIARTPRNVFRNSLRGCLPEVELPIGLGGVTSYQIQTNSECRQITRGVRVGVLRSRSERGRTQTTG